MSIERVKRLLKEKEHIRLEFKEAATALPVNLFETICAMLNRDGGDILLGVNNEGKITGVDSASVNTMAANLSNLSNNQEKLDPPFLLTPQIHEMNGKYIIHVQVPSSSQVHKNAKVIFDRSNDGDFKITRPHQVADCYNRKRNHYTESIVYPFLRFLDFKESLFPKVRNLIKSNDANHPWLALDNVQMMEKAGLWKRDFQSGQEGYTLAAALLFGKDEVIQQILPHYKIDALVRIDDKYRYDDRLYIQTNLIDAYEQLMDFVAKHLPDKFYLRGDQRISLRTAIFREVVANLIVHREYTNAYPCTFIIHEGKVTTENANNPHGAGPIDPNNFAPFPKNPAIAKFFIQLGRVDELGSGVLNVNKYIKEYSGKPAPLFFEGDVFKIVVPVPEVEEEEVGLMIQDEKGIINVWETEIAMVLKDQKITEPVRARINDILYLIKNNPGIKVAELRELTNISERTLKNNIKTLVRANLIIYTGSKKIGGYFPTQNLLEIIKTPT